MGKQMRVTVFPTSSNDFDLFDAVMHDDNQTSMVYSLEELEELTEADEICRLLGGEEIQVLLPAEGEFSFESEQDTLRRAREAELAELEKEWTQERIQEHKMLHGYDPREDW